jgi:hypothetical protein
VTQQLSGPVAWWSAMSVRSAWPLDLWDPIAGCVDPMVAERRAKAFTPARSRLDWAVGMGTSARFYAAEAVNVIQAFSRRRSDGAKHTARNPTWVVEHWEKRRGVLAGKAMIVCMSRRICADLYDAIVKLRPEWHSEQWRVRQDQGGYHGLRSRWTWARQASAE